MEEEDKKATRRYARYKKRKSSISEDSPKMERFEKKYGYNYDSAIKSGIEPDETGHWPSRNPDTGEILKGRKHPTIHKTREGEKEAGYKIKRRKGKLYSYPKE